MYLLTSQLHGPFTTFTNYVQTEILGVLTPVLGIVALVIAVTMGISIFMWLMRKL